MSKRGRNTVLAAVSASVTFAALVGATAQAQAAYRSPVTHLHSGRHISTTAAVSTLNGRARRGGPPPGISLQSWGLNNFDQLGYSTSGDQTLPRNVVPAATGPCDAANMRSIKQLAAGTWSTLVLLRNGDVCGFGRNDFGELGQGTVSSPVVTPSPVCAPYSTTSPCAPLRATQIANGGLFGVAIVRGIYRPNPSVALRDAVVTFGSGMTGELGQGRTFADTDVPKLVCGVATVPNNGPTCPRTDTSARAFLSGATQITAGQYDTAVLVAGKVYSFGDNTWCPLGVGNTCTLGLRGGRRGPYTGNCHVSFTESPTNCSPDPVRALTGPRTPLSGVKAISAGNGSVTMALLRNGQVMTFGLNFWDQLGNGRSGLGSPDTCYNNNTATRAGCSWYARPVASNPNPSSPCHSTNRRLSGVTAISAGFFTNLALLNDGLVCSFGSGSTYGNLGDGAFNNSDVPVAVCAISTFCSFGQYLTGVTQISAGADGNNLAVVSGAGGSVVAAWGDNQHGQLGQDTTSTGMDRPVLVCATPTPNCPTGPYLTGITQISSGNGQELALP